MISRVTERKIRDHISNMAVGRPVTVLQLVKLLGLGRQYTHQILVRAEELGLVKRDGRRRWVRIASKEKNMAEISSEEAAPSTIIEAAAQIEEATKEAIQIMDPRQLSYEAKIHATNLYYQNGIQQVLNSNAMSDELRSYFTSLCECAP